MPAGALPTGVRRESTRPKARHRLMRTARGPARRDKSLRPNARASPATCHICMHCACCQGRL
jgi:hypothetical protein